MFIQRLNNPITKSYLDVKDLILSEFFPWYWNNTSTPNQYARDSSKYTNVPFYSHSFLLRPEDLQIKFPEAISTQTQTIAKILVEILKFNNIKINSFLRINANCINGSKKSVNSIPHRDHEYDHKNMIVYLTNAGGKIFVNGESHDPKEDDVIVFDGLEHYIQTPLMGRRICIVATFF